MKLQPQLAADKQTQMGKTPRRPNCGPKLSTKLFERTADLAITCAFFFFEILKDLPVCTQCQLVYTAHTHTQIVYIEGSVYFVFLSFRNEGKGKKKEEKENNRYVSPKGGCPRHIPVSSTVCGVHIQIIIILVNSNWFITIPFDSGFPLCAIANNQLHISR